ncbi:hypothetical protein RUM44_011571 [Polyplax serrata]|uniref:Uncharacterized protein n=1 Tax=Polyplax serrata TaxID=468196 RepID=A0ABR1AQG5_POLSC
MISRAVAVALGLWLFLLDFHKIYRDLVSQWLSFSLSFSNDGNYEKVKVFVIKRAGTREKGKDRQRMGKMRQENLEAYRVEKKLALDELGTESDEYKEENGLDDDGNNETRK